MKVSLRFDIFATHKLIIAAGKTQPPWDFSQLTLQYMDENVELYSRGIVLPCRVRIH